MFAYTHRPAGGGYDALGDDDGDAHHDTTRGPAPGAGAGGDPQAAAAKALAKERGVDLIVKEVTYVGMYWFGVAS